MPYYQKLGQIPRKHHIWFNALEMLIVSFRSGPANSGD